jgi:hypothetical protein
MKYSFHSCVVISQLIDSFLFLSLFIYFHTAFSVLIAFIYFPFLSLLCFFFFLHLPLYHLFASRKLFLLILSSSILLTPLLLPYSIVHILCPTTHFSFLFLLLPFLLLLMQLLLSVLPPSSLIFVLQIRLFLVYSYTLLLLGHPIFLLQLSSVSPLLFLFPFLHCSFLRYLFLAENGPTLLFLLFLILLLFPMYLRLLFPNLSLFFLCYLSRSIPLVRPLVCFHSILPIHFLQFILSVSSPLHFPSCLWIFFSHPPLNCLIFPLPRAYILLCFLLLYLLHFLLLSSSLCYILLSLFSTICCLYVRFFPYILLLLPFLVSFL